MAALKHLLARGGPFKEKPKAILVMIGMAVGVAVLALLFLTLGLALIEGQRGPSSISKDHVDVGDK